MYALIEPFVQIALLRRKPQDLPVSRLLLQVTLIAHAFMGMLMFAPQLALPQALLAGITNTLLMGVLTASLLFATGMSKRITQSLTAMAGSDVVVSLVALPVTLMLQGEVNADSTQQIASLLAIILVVWNLFVIGHVLRHAISSTLPVGIALSLVFIVLSFKLTHSLFPSLA